MVPPSEAIGSDPGKALHWQTLGWNATPADRSFGRIAEQQSSMPLFSIVQNFG